MGKIQQKLSDNHIEELRAIIAANDSKGPEVRRAQTILLIDQGSQAETIKAMTGYGRTRAFTLRKKYLTDGVMAIRDRREGQPKELLTKQQRADIVEMVKTKSPKDCGMLSDRDYWSTGLLGRYIKETYGAQYKSKTSVYIIFRKAAFTYHKPGKVSERRNEQEVKEWRVEAKKRLVDAWNDPDTVILTEDEMHLSNQTTVQKIWLPKGEYPKIEIARKRASRSIYGFLNIKTGVEHAFKTLWQNMYITAQILPQIRALYPDKKILLLWDQAGWHKGKEAQRVIREDGNMKTLYFPTAAPDENPQEHVWKNGRAHISHNECLKDIDAGTDKFVEYLTTATFPYSLVGFSSLS